MLASSRSPELDLPAKGLSSASPRCAAQPRVAPATRDARRGAVPAASRPPLGALQHDVTELMLADLMATVRNPHSVLCSLLAMASRISRGALATGQRKCGLVGVKAETAKVRRAQRRQQATVIHLHQGVQSRRKRAPAQGKIAVGPLAVLLPRNPASRREGHATKLYALSREYWAA